MKHANTILLLLIFAALLPVAAAEPVQTQYFPNNIEIDPGTTAEVGTIQVTTGNNTTLRNVSASIEFPFNSTVTPSNYTTIAANTSRNFSLNVSPPGSFPSGQLTRQLSIETANPSVSQQVAVNITELDNWTARKENVSRNLSVGSQGTFVDIPLEQQGNKPTRTVSTNVSGNISTFLSMPDELTVYRENPQNLTVSYDIQRDQEFGYYNGTLTLRGGNQTENVSMKAQLFDRLDPEIGATSIKDVPATKEQEFKVKVTDNLNVSNVTATVYTREIVNGSVKLDQFSDFEFESDGNDLYTYTFDDSDLPGDYQLKITATDSSGNTVNTTERFKVEKLNAVQIPDNNFGLGHVIRGEQRSHPAFTLNTSTAVTLSLHSITPSNTSVKLGIRKDGEPAAQFFKNGIGDKIEVKETGTYHVVALGKDSELAKRDFQAQINVDAEPDAEGDQHVDVSNLIFYARLIGGYGRPINDTYSGMDVSLYYKNFVNGTPQTKVLHAEADAEDCQGTATMTECIPDLNMNKTKEQAQTIQNLRTKNRWKNGALFFLAGFFVVAMLVQRQRNKYAGVLKTRAKVDFSEVMGGRMARNDQTDEGGDDAAGER